MYIVSDSYTGHSKFLQHSQVNVYTDGSKSEAGVGAALHVLQQGYPTLTRRFTMPLTSTVFLAEIEALHQAGCFLREEALARGIRYVKIFSDSRSSLQALDSYKTKSQNVVKAMMALNDAAVLTKNVSLVWIRAHTGRAGNEAADQAAKEAANSGPNSPECSPQKLPMSYYKNLIYNTSLPIRLANWRASKKGAATLAFASNFNPKRTKELLQLDRSGLAVLLSLLTGHDELRYFVSKKDPHIPPTCRFCKNADETFLHLLTSCKPLSAQRLEVFGKSALPIDVTQIWTVDKLMEFISITQVAKLALGPLSDKCLFNDDSSDTPTNDSGGQCAPFSVSSHSSSSP